MDSSETWFIDRWQWEKGQCTRTILCYPVYLLSTIKIDIKLAPYIDVKERKCRRKEQ